MISRRRKDYILDVYNNISELYNDLKDKPRRITAKSESEDEDDESWAGTKSLKEAFDLMLHGDEKKYNQIKDTIKKLKINKILGNAIKGNTTYNNVVGYQVNVSNYLLGIPTDMIDNIPKKRSQKILNIVINNTSSCGVSSASITKGGAYYYGLIDLLEKSGYRCNIYMMSNFETSQDIGMCLVRVKTDREPFNREKMAFLMANPSFQRRVGFKWIESCNCKGEPTKNGYGMPLTNSIRIKSIVDKELKANFIVWNLQEDYKVKIEDIVNRLKEQGIEVGGEQ